MSDQPTFPAIRRPGSLIWVCVGLLLAGAYNIGTALRAAQFAQEYTAQGLSFPATLRLFAGFLWGSAFAWAAWRLWMVQGGMRRWTAILAGADSLFEVIWQRAFARSDYAADRLPFLILTAALGVALTWWLLNRPRVLALFLARLAKQPAEDVS